MNVADQLAMLVQPTTAASNLTLTNLELDELVDDLAVIVWEADAGTCQCVYVNQYATSLLGYSTRQWRATPAFLTTTLIHPDDRDQFGRMARDLSASKGSRRQDVRLIAADGRIVWVQLAAHLTSTNRIRGVMVDITEHKLIEDALRADATRFRIMSESATDLISLHTPDGVCRYVAPSCRRLLGYTVEDLIGRCAYDLVHPDDSPMVCQTFATVLAQAGTATAAYRIRSKDGQWIWFETTCCVLRDSLTDTVLEIYAASRDITERKRAEEERAQSLLREQMALAEAEVLRKIDLLKSEFIANVSHELRTPLHHIKGYASTLLRPRLPFDEQATQEYLRIISEESDKLERLIVDLLDTSHIETGTMKLDLDSVQMDELVQKVVRHWQETDGHHFEAVIPAIVPPIAADPYRLQQVLDNLLVNVVRHTPQGTSTIIGIEVSREELIVSVCDDGPGISPEHLPFVFDRFYQVDGQVYQRRRGNGLGLYICKAIIEQHGGRIWVEAMPGPGTTFRFSLPRRHSSARRHQGSRTAANHKRPDI